MRAALNSCGGYSTKEMQRVGSGPASDQSFWSAAATDCPCRPKSSPPRMSGGPAGCRGAQRRPLHRIWRVGDPYLLSHSFETPDAKQSVLCIVCEVVPVPARSDSHRVLHRVLSACALLKQRCKPRLVLAASKDLLLIYAWPVRIPRELEPRAQGLTYVGSTRRLPVLNRTASRVDNLGFPRQAAAAGLRAAPKLPPLSP